MKPWLIFIGILISVEAMADYVTGLWADRGSTWLFALAIVLYVGSTTAWLLSVKYGAGIARGGVIFAVASLVMAVLMGIFIFHETYSLKQLIGIVLGCIAFFLLV